MSDLVLIVLASTTPIFVILSLIWIELRKIRRIEGIAYRQHCGERINLSVAQQSPPGLQEQGKV